MSYDVDVGEADFNYTYNLSRFFHAHIRVGEETGLRSLDGMTGAQAVKALDEAFDSARDELREVGDAELRRRYEPSNGRGSLYGATLFLAELQAACAANRRKRVRVT